MVIKVSNKPVSIFVTVFRPMSSAIFNVLFVPGLDVNLSSIAASTNLGGDVTFKADNVIYRKGGVIIVTVALTSRRLYNMNNRAVTTPGIWDEFSLTIPGTFHL